MNPIRYGVVGLGHRGREIGKLAAKFDYTVFAAACDLKPSNWTQTQWLSDRPLAEMFPDAVFYDDFDRMLSEADLDVVIVETGADVHASFCAKALERGKYVLSDIPLVWSLAEAKMLWETQKKAKRFLSIGANPNFQKFTVMLDEYYQNGMLGKPYFMEAEYIHWSWPGNSESIHLSENGDWRKLLIPIRYCTHSLGPLLTVLDEELRYVSCFGTGPHADLSEYSVPKDDMMGAQFRTESGVVVRLTRNSRCRANIGHHNYRVFGTEGYMERIDRFGKPVIRYNFTKMDNNALHEVNGSFMPTAYENNPDAVGHDGMDYAMLDAFFTAVRDGGKAPVGLKEGLAMTLPGIYAEESAKRGGEVLKIRYPWDDDFRTEI